MIFFSNFNSILPEFILFISGMLLLMYGAFGKNKNSALSLIASSANSKASLRADSIELFGWV